MNIKVLVLDTQVYSNTGGHGKARLESRADACLPARMKTRGDTVTLWKFLRPLPRGLSPELARACSRSNPYSGCRL